jgi:hypothetical protein
MATGFKQSNRMDQRVIAQYETQDPDTVDSNGCFDR